MSKEWTPWIGGLASKPPTGRVEVTLRDGSSGEDLAENFRWFLTNSAGDIIAYRVVDAIAKDPRPCRSPYCECTAGQCTHPGCYDARGEPFTPPTQELKSSNPKDALGANKLPYHLWPQAATAMGSLGLMEGALKYGRNNWRVHGVLATTYGAAAKRHIDAWLEGEDRTTDSQNFHLSNALACLAIIVDAKANGKLIDDRNYSDTAKIGAFLAELTKEVPRLRTTFAGYAPHHYTIGDYGLETRNDVHPVGASPLPQAGAVPPREDEQPVQQRDS